MSDNTHATQVIFFTSFPEDRLFIKLLVLVLAALEICQSALVSRDIYTALVVASIGINGTTVTPINIDGTTASISSATLDSIQNHWVSIPVIGGISGSIGQFFFAYRIWTMSQHSPTGNIRRARAGTRIPGIIVATVRPITYNNKTGG